MRRIWSYFAGDSDQSDYNTQETEQNDIETYGAPTGAEPTDERVPLKQEQPPVCSDVTEANVEDKETGSLGSVAPEPNISTQMSEHSMDAFIESIEKLKMYETSLNDSAIENESVHTDANDALRMLAEVLVWADQHDSTIWDSFMELGVMALLVRCLQATKTYLQRTNSAESPAERRPITLSSTSSGHLDTIHSVSSTSSETATATFDDVGLPSENLQFMAAFESQLLQMLSIVVQSVSNTKSLYCLFSANHINCIIEFGFHLSIDEQLSYFITLLKTISQKLDPTMLQLFFDPVKASFPLYSCAIRHFDASERMVRIAVRNITLNVFAVRDHTVITFTLRGARNSYLSRLMDYISRLSGSVARALELVLDDGMEIARTRRRTGIFRKRVRCADVAVRLAELEAQLLYIADIHALGIPVLCRELQRVMSARFFASFFRPLASRALPMPQSRWPRAPTDSLATFDAGARTALLTFVVLVLSDSRLCLHVLAELLRPARDFARRSVLHALRAMTADLDGTERLTYLALRAIEALLTSPAMSREALAVAQLTLDATAPAAGAAGAAQLVGVVEPVSDDEPVLMTLTDFEAPLTPCSSLPTTPTYEADDSKSLKEDISALKRTPLNQWLGSEDGEFDEDSMLMSFKTGDVSLRDALTSTLLVVRKRDARSLRVVQCIARIVSLSAERTNSWLGALDVASSCLDEIGSALKEFINDRRTTIVSLESAFTNYRNALYLLDKNASKSEVCDMTFTSEDLATTAALKPKSVGRIRRPLIYDYRYTPPIELEDAFVLFIMVRLYERAYRVAYDGLEAQLSAQLGVVFSDIDEGCTYLEKRDALNDIAAVVLKVRPT